MCRRLFAAACLVLLPIASHAQLSKPGMGTVTGHVICQDTQKPARFAQVMVFAVPSSLTTFGNVDASDSKALKNAQKVMSDAMRSASFVLGETGFDGSFTMIDVAPGDYYVMASVAGYIQPLNLVQAAVDAGQDVTKNIPGVPMVHVSADRSVNADISVSRGAAVEGHVLWDDGTPVAGAYIEIEPKTTDHKPLPPQLSLVAMNGMGSANTDDRGHYRTAGLAPGEYTVQAVLQTNRHMAMQRGKVDSTGFGSGPLMVYAPGGFRKREAKPVTLTAGEEQTDEDITFNLSSTHTVSGRVTSAEDHHGLNQGVVTLTDTDEKTFRRSGGLDSDGNFTIAFVPSGTYTMTIANAADTVPKDLKLKDPDDGELFTQVQTKTLRSYQKAEQQVLVTDGDLTDQNVELRPDKTSVTDDNSGGI